MRSGIQDGRPSPEYVHPLIGFIIDLRTFLDAFLFEQMRQAKQESEAFIADILQVYFDAYLREVWVVAHSMQVSDTIPQMMIQDVYRAAAHIERVTYELMDALTWSPDQEGRFISRLAPLPEQKKIVQRFLDESEQLNRLLDELRYLSLRTEERELIHSFNKSKNELIKILETESRDSNSTPGQPSTETSQNRWSEWMSKEDVKRELNMGIFRTLTRNSGKRGWPIIEAHSVNSKLARYRWPDATS
jgi:hypothetical protein